MVKINRGGYRSTIAISAGPRATHYGACSNEVAPPSSTSRKPTAWLTSRASGKEQFFERIGAHDSLAEEAQRQSPSPTLFADETLGKRRVESSVVRGTRQHLRDATFQVGSCGGLADLQSALAVYPRCWLISGKSST